MDLSVLTKGLKETAVGQLGKWFVDKWGIENQGVMDTFKVDTENKIFDITLKLKDHEQPMDLKIQYSLETRDGKDVLILTPMEGSEEWIRNAISGDTVRNFFDKPIVLPPLVATAVKHFL
ncbi:MAG: hypothetical protein ACFUZC_09650 [Chthoniobacteraceae bacterium]